MPNSKRKKIVYFENAANDFVYDKCVSGIFAKHLKNVGWQSVWKSSNIYVNLVEKE